MLLSAFEGARNCGFPRFLHEIDSLRRKADEVTASMAGGRYST
jgi:hypothetical protein